MVTLHGSSCFSEEVVIISADSKLFGEYFWGPETQKREDKGHVVKHETGDTRWDKSCDEFVLPGVVSRLVVHTDDGEVTGEEVDVAGGICAVIGEDDGEFSSTVRSRRRVLGCEYRLREVFCLREKCPDRACDKLRVRKDESRSPQNKDIPIFGCVFPSFLTIINLSAVIGLLRILVRRASSYIQKGLRLSEIREYPGVVFCTSSRIQFSGSSGFVVRAMWASSSGNVKP